MQFQSEIKWKRLLIKQNFLTCFGALLRWDFQRSWPPWNSSFFRAKGKLSVQPTSLPGLPDFFPGSSPREQIPFLNTVRDCVCRHDGVTPGLPSSTGGAAEQRTPRNTSLRKVWALGLLMAEILHPTNPIDRLLLACIYHESELLWAQLKFSFTNSLSVRVFQFSFSKVRWKRGLGSIELERIDT